jgi:hypothetical protein
MFFRKFGGLVIYEFYEEIDRWMELDGWMDG